MTQNRARVSRILHVYNTRTPDTKAILDVAQTYPQEWAEVEERLVENNTKDYKSDNYIHYQRYYELECKMYLRKGDVITFEKITGSGSDANQTKEYGFIVIGEIKVEADFSKIEESTFDDSGVGTEPDETNYDVYGHLIDVPQENLFKIAAVMVLFTLIPLYYGNKEYRKRIGK